MGVSSLLLKYLLAGIGTVISISVINIFWKISVHMASIGAMLGLLIIANFANYLDSRLMIAGIILIAGIVASARLFANAHNISQIVSGFVLGFAWILMVL